MPPTASRGATCYGRPRCVPGGTPEGTRCCSHVGRVTYCGCGTCEGNIVLYGLPVNVWVCEQLVQAADKAAAVFRGGPLMQSESVETETPVMARRVRGASICFPGGRAVGFGSLRNGPYPPSQTGKLTKSQGWRDDRAMDCGGKRSATPL